MPFLLFPPRKLFDDALELLEAVLQLSMARPQILVLYSKCVRGFYQQRRHLGVVHAGYKLAIFFIGDDLRQHLADLFVDKADITLAAVFFVPVKVHATNLRELAERVSDRFNVALPADGRRRTIVLAATSCKEVIALRAVTRAIHCVGRATGRAGTSTDPRAGRAETPAPDTNGWARVTRLGS